MISGIAFCPHPPLIVPAVAAGAAPELDDLRSACDEAVRELLATRPERIAVVGPGPATTWFEPDSVGSLAPYGIDLVVEPQSACRTQTGSAPALPLSLTIGCWLLGRAGWTGSVSELTLAADVPLEDLQREAAALDRPGERTGLLVMADGSSTRTEKAPGSWQPRALAFDAEVAKALGSGDPACLGGLDRAMAREVGAMGWVSWRAAAIATAGRSWRAQVSYEDAPYGVGYLVAAWT